MMLGGVGFQAGVDEARRKQLEAQRETAVRAAQAPAAPRADVVEQLRHPELLRRESTVVEQRLQVLERKVLGD